MNYSELLSARQWAVWPPVLESIATMSASWPAPTAEHAAPSHGGRPGGFTRVGNTAIIGLRGVVMQDDTFLSWLISLIYGGTILENFKDSLAAAVADASILRIVLEINSPGGEAMGIEEAAKAIRAANAKKPVTAFVDGMAASAAYWLASAAGRIVLSSQSSQVGSVGVVLTMRDTRARDAAAGIKTHEIVSSQSPMKRVDPETEEGLASLKAYVDRFAAIFVDAIAGYRGKDADAVLQDFGRGGMVFAADAVKVGMADAVMTREELMRSLEAGATGNNSGGLTAQNKEGGKMEGQEQPDIAKAKAEAAAEERNRIGAILSLPEAKGREKLTQTLALQPAMTADAAKEVLALTPTAHPLAKAMEGVPNPNVGAGGEPSEEAESVDGFMKRLRTVRGEVTQ